MSVIKLLQKIWSKSDEPFLIYKNEKLTAGNILKEDRSKISKISSGDCVALIGDFNAKTISILLKLIDTKVIIVPLTKDTKIQHEKFFEIACVNWVIENDKIQKRICNKKNKLIEKLKSKNKTGLILFTSGTTGEPKAILHDFDIFLERYKVPRPALRTINFLLFDHIGGLNTMFHTLFNKGLIVAPEKRSLENIILVCKKFNIELLPTTPTFLRMLLLSGMVPKEIPSCIKIITYGTERMDEYSLNSLCNLLPNVDFRQTYGMSEFGILRVKSESRNSLFMKVGGEGVETKIVNQTLFIKSKNKMLGYLNASYPFDNDGWFNTQDKVNQKGGYIKIIGRDDDTINIGGLKFMPKEIEDVVLEYPNVLLNKLIAKSNPITGQHIELDVEVKDASKFNKKDLLSYLNSKLPSHMLPKRINIKKINVSHRFKKA